MSAAIAIVGAGPGGISAAVTAAENGAVVTLIDENPGLGGQIWRQKLGQLTSKEARQWVSRLNRQNIKFLPSTTVLGKAEGGLICTSREKGRFFLKVDKIILANGAKELFLPFPGWTLPNVIGCGGAQALVKSGLNVAGKRIVVAGSGPLLLAVAFFLKCNGAKIAGVYEQADPGSINKFVAHLLFSHPAKLWQGIVYRAGLLGVPFKTGWWIKQAEGGDSLEKVTVTDGKNHREIDCDYVACGFGLVPNTELASVIGCQLRDKFVEVDEEQQSSIENVYAVGELTGIGGLDKALLEGIIAGAAASCATNRKVIKQKLKMERFTSKLAETYRLRPQVKSLSEKSTVFCRCEDVLFSEVCNEVDQRTAKLYTRCGMGSCQGRVCAAMGRELFGWELNKIAAPIVPLEVDQLLE